MRPILCEIAGMPIYTYGVCVLVACIVTLVLARRSAERLGFEKPFISDLVLAMFVVGILGARLFYVLQHPDQYQADWRHAFYLQEGGLVWYGGLLTATVVGVTIGWARKWPFLRLLDLFAPLVALAEAIGRLGCFFNGCCYGRIGALHGMPIQLFWAALLAGLSGALFYISHKRTHREGELFATYLFLYGVLRFFVEFFRSDQTHYGRFSAPQWTSLGLVIVSVVLILIIRKQSSWKRSH